MEMVDESAVVFHDDSPINKLAVIAKLFISVKNLLQNLSLLAAMIVQCTSLSHKLPQCIMVGVLAIGSEVCGFRPYRGDGFLRVLKICSTPSRGEVKPLAPCHKILRHVRNLLGSTNKNNAKFVISFSCSPACC
jgi:hypothetical protein